MAAGDIKLFPRLRPLRPDSNAFLEEEEEERDSYCSNISRFVILYDDDSTLEGVSRYVPPGGRYECHFLRHKLPSHRAAAYELYAFQNKMQLDYTLLDESVREGVRLYSPAGGGSPPTVGLISLCKHADAHADVAKQAVLAYLLTNLDGNLEEAWKTMLEWMGHDEDHWTNISELFYRWVLPHLYDSFNPNAKKTVCPSTSLSSLEDGVEWPHDYESSGGSDREELLSQYSY